MVSTDFTLQALDILRRTYMMPLKSEISITYIPASDAAVFKASALSRLGTEQPDEPVDLYLLFAKMFTIVLAFFWFDGGT